MKIILSQEQKKLKIYKRVKKTLKMYEMPSSGQYTHRSPIRRKTGAEALF